MKQDYDLVLLSCKAYDLEQAITDSPAVGLSTRILPLLNRMRHMEMLDDRFGSERVLGSLCMIATSFNSDGEIVHTGQLQSLTMGARDPVNEGSQERSKRLLVERVLVTDIFRLEGLPTAGTVYNLQTALPMFGHKIDDSYNRIALPQPPQLSRSDQARPGPYPAELKSDRNFVCLQSGWGGQNAASSCRRTPGQDDG